MSKTIHYKKIAIWISVVLILIFVLDSLMGRTALLEQYYSRGFYPIFAYLPKLLFSWIPFSIGDLLYACLGLGILCQVFRIGRALFSKQFRAGFFRGLKLILFMLCLYTFFNISWGLNYYRVPISVSYGLKTDTILLADHLRVLEDHINRANRLREGLALDSRTRQQAQRDVETLMQEDQQFPMLSKTQVHIKNPLSNQLAAAFGVSGYFNPFTQEAHINGAMPLASYPFTVSHELAHQMGIGFEDECNFIAFVKLHQQQEPWYAYSAYYESVGYLLRTLYLVDKTLFEQYRSRLSPKILADLKADQEFWLSHSGWIADLSGLFYNQYLKHNNQAEGMARYGLVSRLIIQYEKKKRPLEQQP